MSDIRVTTHVGRDLLQAAQLFRSPEAAIWEYVVNGLEYVDQGVPPEVEVRVDSRRKRVTITDNGRGMDVAGLQHYFTMHAENPDRRLGRKGRGKFGTGKSAAFGIARRLEVATVRDGLRNVVELTRAQIEASSGEEIPLNWIVRDEPVDAANGTVVTIDDVIVRRISSEQIVRTVERHLAFWRGVDAKVIVDTQVCEPRMPTSVGESIYLPSPEEQQLLGNVGLVVRVAPAPLEEGLYGVAVTTAPGALVAIETGGYDRKEFGSQLFGEVECAALEDYESDLAPYNSSRSLKLNPEHPVAATLLAFIGRALEQERKKLVEEQRKRRAEQEYKDLDREASRIAQLLNEDLAEVRERFDDLDRIRRREGTLSRAGEASGGSEPDVFVEGGEEPGLLDRRDEGDAERIDGGRDAPELARRGALDAGGTEHVEPAGGTDGRRRPRGGIKVEYRNLGDDEDRGVYDPRDKAILINLDHPMVEAAKSVGGIEDVAFRRLSYEIAFTEYAMALARELLEHDPDLSGEDVLFEVRSALKRVTRRAGSLYAAS